MERFFTLHLNVSQHPRYTRNTWRFKLFSPNHLIHNPRIALYE